MTDNSSKRNVVTSCDHQSTTVMLNLTETHPLTPDVEVWGPKTTCVRSIGPNSHSVTAAMTPTKQKKMQNTLAS